MDHNDRLYSYFLAELLCCYTLSHDGETHECVFVRYLWPDVEMRDLPMTYRLRTASP